MSLHEVDVLGAVRAELPPDLLEGIEHAIHELGELLPTVRDVAERARALIDRADRFRAADRFDGNDVEQLEAADAAGIVVRFATGSWQLWSALQALSDSAHPEAKAKRRDDGTVHYSPGMTPGYVHDCRTVEAIRPATAADREAAASGEIMPGGRRVFLLDQDDNVVSEEDLPAGDPGRPVFIA